MQTFLPYKSFERSAKCLDNKRLGKQRVEVLQILKALLQPSSRCAKAWGKHPAVRMWKGYESYLFLYGTEICGEWKKRGYRDSCWKKMLKLFKRNLRRFLVPPWLGDRKLHSSHKSALLNKNYNWYKRFKWKVKPEINYYWPKN